MLNTIFAMFLTTSELISSCVNLHNLSDLNFKSEFEGCKIVASFIVLQDGSEWQKLLDEFDWKRSAALYFFRKKKMEDYFRVLHVLLMFSTFHCELVLS